MKTIGNIIHHNHKKYNLIINDDNGNQLYFENSFGYWWQAKYDDNGKEIYCENSVGYWCKCEFDLDSGHEIYCEDSDGYLRDER